MTFELKSSAFGPGQNIPARYACDGEHVSPPLTWSGAPQRTATFTFIVDDPDAPRGTFTHWVLFNIPGNVDHLDQHVPQTQHLANGAVQGSNDFGSLGYGAPCPPKGKAHHYRFTLYALDGALNLPAGVSREQVFDAMQGHVLDQAQLVGTYQRE
ncbi:MAG: YbhB/YbcL family Raf kinase inhibitor-like protein [Ktedonobacterales bacterium]